MSEKSLQVSDLQVQPVVEVPASLPILMCPVCSSVVDAEQWGHNSLECACGTPFTVDLDPDIVARHAIV